MKKEKSAMSRVVACAFVLLMVGVMFVGVVPVIAAMTWTVDDSGGADFTSIHDAVNAANSGDTVIVRDGIYIENVNVNKHHLTIQSENGADSTIVQSANPGDYVFEVTASKVNIIGFTVTGATDSWKAGIFLEGADHCTISENTASNNFYGIRLESYSSENTLSGNTANSNIWGGIQLSISSGNMLSCNTANSNNWNGIQLSNSHENTLSGNTFNSNNDVGIYLDHSSGNMLSANTASNSICGILLRDSSNNKINRNDFVDNGENVRAVDSTNRWNSPEEITYTYNGNTHTNYLGNYWSDYTGSDTDEDGIGDTPYYISDGGQNNYPLMEPWQNYIIITSHAAAEWQDERDEMIVPYDKVDLKFTIMNNLPTTLHDVTLSFQSNTDLISIEEESIDIGGSVAPGAEFYAENSIIIAGVENEEIMRNIIDVHGPGKIFLTDSIIVTVEYNSGSQDFTLTPTDEDKNPLYLQYPDFKPKEGDLYYQEKDDVDDYYMKGDNDFSHTTDLLVRKYAVKAAVHNDGVFPDDPAKVSFNVFRYVDDTLDDDWGYGKANNDLFITTTLNYGDLNSWYPDILWICIPQAYLFTSFERTLGFPSRELTVGEGVHVNDSEKPKIRYAQNGAAEVWHNGRWNFYDPWNSRTWTKNKEDDYLGDILGLGDLIDKTSRIVRYRAWYAFDKQTSKTLKNYNYKGHKFQICDRDCPILCCDWRGGSPMIPYCNQWKFLEEDSGTKSSVMMAGSPIKMLIIDSQGRMVGSTDEGVVIEIPGAKYMPPGQIGYTDKGDPDTAFELDEFISLPDNFKGDYELIIKGIGDGEYNLYFAQFDPSAADEYSDVTTFTYTIKENELHRYEVSIDETISPVRIACGDVNGDGKVTMSDVRKVFNRYLDPNYPLDLLWAADVNCDRKVTMSDVRKVFNRYLDPGYELNCCCEEVG